MGNQTSGQVVFLVPFALPLILIWLFLPLANDRLSYLTTIYFDKLSLWAWSIAVCVFSIVVHNGCKYIDVNLDQVELKVCTNTPLLKLSQIVNFDFKCGLCFW